jgi:hypothetical protein
MFTCSRLEHSPQPSTSLRCEMEAAWGAGLQDQLGAYGPQIVSILWMSTRWSGLGSGLHFAPQTSTSAAFLKGGINSAELQAEKWGESRASVVC